MRATRFTLVLYGLAACCQLARGQVAELAIELEGIECGGFLVGSPGEVITIEGYATVTTDDDDVRAWSIGIGGEGASIQFNASSVETCDSDCAAGVIGKPVAFNSPGAVDPGLDPGDGPLAGGPQGQGLVDGLALSPPGGILDPGTTRLLSFSFDVTVPEEVDELVRISFVDGLRGPSLLVFNTISVGATSVDADNGLTLGECFLTISPQQFRRADSNDDGMVDVSDAITTLSRIFLGDGDKITCDDAADANDDGMVDVTDPIVTLEWKFLGIADIPPPGTKDCGKDPTPDELPRCVSTQC